MYVIIEEDGDDHPGGDAIGVYIHWTGLLDWNTGLDYWTDIFLVIIDVVVVLIDA